MATPAFKPTYREARITLVADSTSAWTFDLVTHQYVQIYPDQTGQAQRVRFVNIR